MGPYVFLNALLVGFFAFAALHYFWHWWLSRGERVLIVFALHCCACAALSPALIALAMARTVAEAQAALDARVTIGLLAQPLIVAVLSLVTGVCVRAFIYSVLVACLILIGVNLLVAPLAGAVTSIVETQLPWGEVITMPQRGPTGWWLWPIYALVFSVQIYGLWASTHMWRRDRVGALLVGLSTVTMLTTLGISLLIDVFQARMAYLGLVPNAVFVVLIALSLSREYARRGRRLAVSEALYRTLIDSAPEAIVVLDVNRGSFSDFNRNACNLFDVPVARIRALSPVDLSPVRQPDGRESAEAAKQYIQEAMVGGRPVFEWTHRSTTGREIPSEVRLVRLPDPSRVLIRGSVTDISERKRAEQALRLSEERYRMIIRTQTEFIVKWRPDGTRTFVNESYCRYFGLREEECIGTSFFPLIAPEFRDAIARKIASLTPEKPEATDEHMSFVAGGGQRWQEWTDVGVFDAAGKLIELLSTGRDITERKRAEEKLQLYSERLKALSHQVLHTQETERRRLARELHDEIGQMLTAIGLRLHQFKGRAAAELQTVLDEDIEVVNRTIEQVREMSLNLRPPMLDVLGLEAALRWYADNQRQRTGLDIRFTSQLDHMPRYPDLEIACFRVMQEALTNVVRHAQARSVVIELRQEEAELHLMIRDDGIGFDVIGVQERAGRGQSFGVLAMQERVELVGGRLEIESGLGRGTRIDARFPLVQWAETAPEAAP